MLVNSAPKTPLTNIRRQFGLDGMVASSMQSLQSIQSIQSIQNIQSVLSVQNIQSVISVQSIQCIRIRISHGPVAR